MALFNRNKKGVAWGFLLELLIFIALFVAVIFWGQDILKPLVSSKDSVDILKSAIEEVGPLNTGSLKTVSLKLNEDSAIIGFNPNKDFIYTYSGLNLDTFQQTYFMKGYYMQRPKRGCDANKACLCLCEGYAVETPKLGDYVKREDSEIICQNELKCASVGDSIKFKSKMLMPDVFDDWQTRFALSNGKKVEVNRDNHYWEDSFIILRSKLIDPRKTMYPVIDSKTIHEEKESVVRLDHETEDSYKLVSPLIVSGFRDYYTLGIIDVSVVSQGSNTVSICMKKDCK